MRDGKGTSLHRGGIEEAVDIVHISQLTCAKKADLIEHLKSIQQLSPYLKQNGKPSWGKSMEFTPNSAQPWQMIANGSAKIFVTRTHRSINKLSDMIASGPDANRS